MSIQFDDAKQLKRLSNIRKEEEEETVKVFAGKMGIPYLNLATIPISTDALALIPEKTAREAGMAVVQRVGKKIQVVIKNPENAAAKKELEKLKNAGYHPELFLVSSVSLSKAHSFYKEIPQIAEQIKGSVDVSAARMASFKSEIASLEALKTKIESMAHATISDLLELLIGGALATDASDVHIEPQEEKVRIRYRIDGILSDIAELPHETFKFLLGRIKLISELKLNVQDKAQDGRFTIESPDGAIEVRVSTLPGPNGENIVMRILNPKAISLSLSDLGMQPWVEEQLKREIKKPNGMIITTGPTGSGKTTTLYAFIKAVHVPGIKIITLEDPIEYHLTGIEQTQVEPDRGYDFASGLRAILRQDPNVILVGEIRDKETAETAMNASLTGHLVFSTLHTNNAAGTIPRLLDIGIKANAIPPAINVAMAQRLVRKLCTQCAKKSPATADELSEIKKEINAMPPAIPHPSIENLELGHPVGCSECHGMGYKGRIGVYEIILIDDEMEHVILEEPGEADVKEAAIKQGQITMRQDAMLKIVAGLTDLAEVVRVVG